MMIDMDLSDQLKQEAISLGLCDQWQGEWLDGTDRHALLEKYVKGIDFCIANDWPSVEFTKEHFGDILHEHGIYADEEVAIDNASGRVVFLGKCRGTVICRDWSVADIYVLHDSELLVEGHHMAKVFLNLSERAKVNTTSYGGARIKKYTIKTGESNGKRD